MATPVAAETWTISTIDDLGVVGQHASVATRFGTTHVAYYDFTNQDLKYAVSTDDKEWKIETVDKPGDVGEYAAIAVDLKGIPHISYYDATNHDLKYAVKTSSSWKIDVVDSGFTGQHTSIAVDSSLIVYISYLEIAGNNLRCVRGKPGNWSLVLADFNGSVGFGSSVAVDPDKSCAHVSYNDNGANKLRYATNCNGFDLIVLDTDDVAIWTSLAVDASGAVHIAYFANGLRYATNASGTFVTETVDGFIGVEEWEMSIALMPDGRPAIAYHDGDLGMLKLARKNAEGTWTKKILAKGGTSNSICIDKDGRIRVAYRGNESTLRYANN